MKYLFLLISSLIINVSGIYCCHKIINKEIEFKSTRLYIAYILMVLLIFINYSFTHNIIKVLITLLIMFLGTKVLVRGKTKECITIALIMEILIILSETIFAVIIIFLNNIDNNLLAQVYQGKIFTNIVIASIIIIISKLVNLNWLYQKLIKIIDNVSITKVIVLFVIIIICSSFLFYLSFYNTNNVLNLLINFLIISVYFIIIVLTIVKESKYNHIHNKYISTLKELEEYENIINEYRIINHENNNQLSSIRGMTTNKKVRDYIDEIINNKGSENKLLLEQALLIPTGGLRGLIYSKLIFMKNNNINYKLNIDRKINNKLMKNISTKTMLDICQIVGVYLDNAIEAVSNLDNKKITINIYLMGNLNVEVINNYDETFDYSKIDKVGYTTKDGNHGYGLSLVSKLIKENTDLRNERNISKNIFKQKLIIMIKK